ncbi:carboxypeptidase-like regulatory domain-containing protein [Conexibacter stalactiti]|uniref:Carboxypeptidase-like regulatory domain-containing protein n=1 Tax=Conexibacter stalactiti TaxID=1940611 RepID=A0ABU4HVW7_9ACTN|nr:carboxypeptidase-like regulatory domain-containing protein [Conexibacter stalactiti]MDW5597416.1 carboxypeptidase-like regulatory domain-containing protein [Conexibacter stalactiti]MEC5038058.1 carboxypeptidase-like regulatory domain-containing protein [Conexibacter stalactiti]
MSVVRALLTMSPARRRWLTTVAALVLLAAAGAARAPAAEAGSYAIHVCRTPDGGRVEMAPWAIAKPSNASKWAARDNCGGGPFELELSPAGRHPADDYILARFLAPPDTSIDAYQFYRSVQLARRYGWRLRERTAAGFTEVDKCWATSGCAGKGDRAVPFGSSNLLEASGLNGIVSLEAVLSCAITDGSEEECPATAPGARLQLHGGIITIRDDHDPSFATTPSGPLVDTTRTLNGRQPVAIAVADKGGGVYQAHIEVDGRIVETHAIDAQGGACAPPFRAPVPCKLNASAQISLDTAALSDGEHQLRIIVTDATQTNSTAWGPVSIRTANTFCNPAPVSRALGLTTQILRGKRRPRTVVTTPYGRRVRVTGRLTTPSGAPVAGVPLCAVSQDAIANAPLRQIGSVTTDGDGRFSLVVAKGPSRRITFVHRVADGAVADSVVVRARARVELRGAHRSLRNGDTLRLRGRLGAGPYPASGALVELQTKRTGGWQTFGTTRTDRSGRFDYDYTFTRTVGTQKYVMRARVAQQPSYPYATGGSKPVRIFVYG